MVEDNLQYRLHEVTKVITLLELALKEPDSEKQLELIKELMDVLQMQKEVLETRAQAEQLGGLDANQG